MQLLAELVKAVATYYRMDPTTAGVCLSRLPEGNHYASVSRYMRPYGNSKEVVVSFTAPTLEEVITGLTNGWLQLIDPDDATHNLRHTIKAAAEYSAKLC